MEAALLEIQRPLMVSDELAWELVRDEWELLLAIGSGPTGVAAAAAAIGEAQAAVVSRVALLLEHGLVRSLGDDTYGLVAAIYQRREGMSSYLRDLVLRRVETGGVPVAGAVRDDVGGAEQIRALLEIIDRYVCPAVVEAASRPESARSERFTVVFAAAADTPVLRLSQDRSLYAELLSVVRGAALQRSAVPDTDTAYLWIAEMRCDPGVAAEIGEIFDTFMRGLPVQRGTGATGFAIVPSGRRGVSQIGRAGAELE